jgi:hypothetical protein
MEDDDNKYELSSQNSGTHRQIKIKSKLVYELCLKIQGSDAKIEVCEGDSVPEIVEQLALQYKLAKEFQDALEIYIDRKLQSENLGSIMSTASSH